MISTISTSSISISITSHSLHGYECNSIEMGLYLIPLIYHLSLMIYLYIVCYLIIVYYLIIESYLLIELIIDLALIE
jgi:hypothetical protein